MATYDVVLPSRPRAKFPDRCLACELPHPTSTAELTVTGAGEGPGLGEALIDAATESRSRLGSNITVTVTVPACPKCAGPLRRRHFWMTFWLYVGALGGVAVAFITLTFVNSVFLMLVIIFAGVLIPVIYNLRHPPAFTFTPMGKQITYEFASELCAKEFADLNGVGKVDLPPPTAETTPPA